MRQHRNHDPRLAMCRGPQNRSQLGQEYLWLSQGPPNRPQAQRGRAGLRQVTTRTQGFVSTHIDGSNIDRQTMHGLNDTAVL